MNAKPDYQFDDDELDEIYQWVDGFRLSRDKRNISRDFSDGLLIAEIVKSVDSSLVDLKQLVETLNTTTKKGNWETLNRMTFTKMGFRFSDDDVDNVVNCKPLAIEHVLRVLRVKIDMYIKEKYQRKNSAERNQYARPPPPVEEPSPAKKPVKDTGNTKLPPIKEAPGKKMNSEGFVGQSPGSYNTKKVNSATPGERVAEPGSPPKMPKKPAPSKKNPAEMTELEKKDEIIKSLEYRLEILQLKNSKLEQLISLKDHKIQYLEGNAKG
jgi:hypothetical protein